MTILPAITKAIPIPGFAEPFSSLSHLLAAGAFLVAGVLLLQQARRCRWSLTSVGIFVFGAVLLLTVSGAYHLVDPHGEAKVVLRRLDYAAIWILIAATFTPVHVILCRGIWRWGMLALVWSGALSGLVVKTVFFQQISETAVLLWYLGLGWCGLLSGIHLFRQHGVEVARPLLAGGVAYTIGAMFELFGEPTLVAGVIGAHELFHIAVIVGLFCHWQLIARVAPLPATGRVPQIASEPIAVDA